MNKNSNINKGRYFEKIATDFLKKKNFKVISSNFQNRHKEIDIICEKNKIIHFIEVKGRTSTKFGEITETISNKKAANIIKTAVFWLMENKKEELDWQIDFIGIEKNYRKIKITFIENAISQR